jgi:hypothetical protein
MKWKFLRNDGTYLSLNGVPEAHISIPEVSHGDGNGLGGTELEHPDVSYRRLTN